MFKNFVYLLMFFSLLSYNQAHSIAYNNQSSYLITTTLPPIKTNVLTHTVYKSGLPTNNIPTNFTYTASICGDITTWNGSTWSNGFPSVSKTTIFNGNYDSSINPPGVIDSCELVINTGFTVTIQSSDYCNVLGNITVNAGGNFIIKNGGKLIFSTTSVSSGNVQIDRETTFMKRYDYTYWSSPVTTQIGNALLPTKWEAGYTFTFNTSNFQDIETSYLGTFISNTPDGQDDNGDVWINTSLTDNMVAGKGYVSMVKSINATGTYPRKETVSFLGLLNTGDIHVPLMLSNNSTESEDDFNIIGNPFPSAISSNAFIDNNINNIGGTLFFWTHSNTLSSAYTGLFALNYSTNDYAKYTKLGGIAAIFGGKQPVNVIGSGQGFLVEAETTNDIIFSPLLMSKAYDNTTAISFFRNVQSDKKIWLNLRTAAGLFSQQLIGYAENTDLTYNKGWDNKTGNTGLISNFYSIEHEIKYDIQSRGNFNIADVIKLGYFSAVAETFTISIDSIVGIDNAWIKDNGVTHSLPYTFTTIVGEYNDRFELVYQNDLEINIPNQIHGILMFPNPTKGTVTIVFKELTKNPIIYNILGLQIELNYELYDNEIIFNVEKLSSGLYFIEINGITLRLIKQ